jgi:hypothetical protein
MALARGPACDLFREKTDAFYDTEDPQEAAAEALEAAPWRDG